MALNIFGVGGFFTVLLLGILLIMQHNDIQSMQDLLTLNYGAYDGLSAYELSLFFTTQTVRLKNCISKKYWKAQQRQ